MSGNPYGLRPKSTPVRIIDILETDGMWMTAEQLEAEFVSRFGAVRLETIKRAIYRLIDQAQLEHRLIEFIDYETPPRTDSRGAQSTPSGYRTKQIMEVRTHDTRAA
jgi:hypothetical protein